MVSATQSLFYYGENQILNDFEDIDAPGRPMLIGGGKLRDYTLVLQDMDVAMPKVSMLVQVESLTTSMTVMLRYLRKRR